MARQYVSVRFRPKDTRTYTYHHDGPSVRVGDKVKIPDKDDDGWRGLAVVSVTEVAPAYPTKPTAGIVDGFDVDAAILAAAPEIDEVMTLDLFGKA